MMAWDRHSASGTTPKGALIPADFRTGWDFHLQGHQRGEISLRGSFLGPHRTCSLSLVPGYQERGQAHPGQARPGPPGSGSWELALNGQGAGAASSWVTAWLMGQGPA